MTSVLWEWPIIPTQYTILTKYQNLQSFLNEYGKLRDSVCYLRVYLVLWTPTILNAQQIPNYYNITSNMTNGTDNEDPQIMMLGCVGQVGKYDELYEELKETDYGKDLKLTEDICHHNVLYYYGICEQVLGLYLWEGNLTEDCSMATFYIEMYKLENQSRPSFYIEIPTEE